MEFLFQANRLVVVSFFFLSIAPTVPARVFYSKHAGWLNFLFIYLFLIRARQT
jgi:hypothetical protein